MESRPNSNRTDPVKSVSNLLREPTENPGGFGPAPGSVVGSEPEFEKKSDELQVPAQRDGGEKDGRSAARRTRDALWRLTVSCLEPILSRLRAYFTVSVADLDRSIASLIDLARSSNRRAVATWHAVGALKERIET